MGKTDRLLFLISILLQYLGFCLIRHGFAVPPSPKGKALSLASPWGEAVSEAD